MNDILKPEDFSIGSPESRAAARMLLEHRQDHWRQFEIVSDIARA